MIVLDASILIARILSEHHSGLTQDLYDAIDTNEIAVPSHWTTEIANALRTNLRRGRLTQADVDSIGGYLSKFEVIIAPPLEVSDIVPLTRFATEHSLTAYDAAYVQIALMQSATLATVDQEMRVCAKKFNIPLLPA